MSRAELQPQRWRAGASPVGAGWGGTPPPWSPPGMALSYRAHSQALAATSCRETGSLFHICLQASSSSCPLSCHSVQVRALSVAAQRTWRVSRGIGCAWIMQTCRSRLTVWTGQVPSGNYVSVLLTWSREDSRYYGWQNLVSKKISADRRRMGQVCWRNQRREINDNTNVSPN